VTEKELLVVLQSLGQQPSIEEVKAMINEIDKDGNGELEVNGARRAHGRPKPSPALALSRSCLVCGLPRLFYSFHHARGLSPTWLARMWLAV
jgi:hypothetical protein